MGYHQFDDRHNRGVTPELSQDKSQRSRNEMQEHIKVKLHMSPLFFHLSTLVELVASPLCIAEHVSTKPKTPPPAILGHAGPSTDQINPFQDSPVLKAWA